MASPFVPTPRFREAEPEETTPLSTARMHGASEED
jgi:hypothetical protein